jgi:hypothetical protein
VSLEEIRAGVRDRGGLTSVAEIAALDDAALVRSWYTFH